MSIESLLSAVLLACAGVAWGQSTAASSADIARRELTRKWLKLKPQTAAERNVLFQELKAGPGGSGFYAFRISVVIRDYEPGNPGSGSFGKTCVTRIEREEYVLKRDELGEWNVVGRLTPDPRETRCQNNPGPGISSIPLSALGGIPATARRPDSQGPATPPTSTRPTVVPGRYVCWANGVVNATLNFTAQEGNRYVGSDGRDGNLLVESGTGRLTFRGGVLDGIMPSGYYAVYHAPQGRPTVSFRMPGDSEAAYCERN